MSNTKKNIDAVKIDKMDELWFNKPISVHVREFAALFALIMLCIAGYKFYKSGTFNETSLILFGASLVLLVIGYNFPKVLFPVWNAWMKFAHLLSIVMTTAIISLAWTGVLLPIALILRIFRVKVMDVTFGEPSVKTYWEDRPEKLHDFKLLERQF